MGKDMQCWGSLVDKQCTHRNDAIITKAEPRYYHIIHA